MCSDERVREVAGQLKAVSNVQARVVYLERDVVCGTRASRQQHHPLFGRPASARRRRRCQWTRRARNGDPGTRRCVDCVATVSSLHLGLKLGWRETGGCRRWISTCRVRTHYAASSSLWLYDRAKRRRRCRRRAKTNAGSERCIPHPCSHATKVGQRTTSR